MKNPAKRTLAARAWRRVGIAGDLVQIIGKAALFAGLAVPLLGCDRRPLPATVGAHSLVFQRYEADDGRPSLSTRPMSTRPGSLLIVSVGRGDVEAFVPPSDNKANAPFSQLGTTHTYTNWPRSGTALYAMTSGRRGEGHVISTATPAADELTLAAVEVIGTKIQDFAWQEVLAGNPLTSPKVTTTGPATLVAFWWGDAGVKGDKKAYPDGEFQLIDAVLESGALVQCAVAVKRVETAGTHEVTWTARPEQGAQLWIVAVE